MVFVSALVQILIAVAINIVAYLILPKPKGTKPPAAKDMDAPTSEAGRPVPVIFGEITVKGSNFLYWGDKDKNTYKVKADGGK